MTTKANRVAVYCRVSKEGGSQETDNQRVQLRGFCERWEGGHGLVAEHVDRECSTTRGSRLCKQSDRTFASAARDRAPSSTEASKA